MGQYDKLKWPAKAERQRLQNQVQELIDNAIDRIHAGTVGGNQAPAEIRQRLQQFDLENPGDFIEVVRETIDLLSGNMIHTMHPGYLGLYNPSVVFPGVAADQITAQLNPQLAAWSHGAGANEIELFTIRTIGARIGWQQEAVAGHFTSGGAEANYTAVLLALTAASPDFTSRGARAFTGNPRLYVSKESHLAWVKIAHQCGIGRDAVRLIATDGRGQMDPAALEEQIENDKAAGDVPVFIAATAGTTNAGMIDPLHACDEIAARHGIWYHVDAAWAGAALFSDTSRQHLDGIERADSVTIDAHKWFAVPMGAGMFICQDAELLSRSFGISTSYMPARTDGAIDPYTSTVQWSRRFSGLKLFLALATLGTRGYAEHIDRAVELAAYLAEKLTENGWNVVNESPFAVICFTDPQQRQNLREIAERVVTSGEGWISVTTYEDQPVLRACITSHFTTEAHLDTLLRTLNEIRKSYN